ncbi:MULTISPECIES: site-specific integrase [unclassified Sporolactobacillus]|uniref:site-specific integrase n=1 Tax=unclassified Sporolactobacillus TaxID=2628533 RepID=UPI002368B16A|nr:site-specific integrase [Sporolactobacillus sp. CQH2019]MDD9150409.1 site-specific integrase [Sporolactobacillus sp. CQH2019]
MRGYIQKRGNKYSFILDLERDPLTGKRRRKRFSGYTRKKDAEKAMAEAINQISKNDFIEPSNQTFEQYAIDWIESKKHNVRETTYTTYKFILDKHINPAIGNKKLDEIKALDLDRLYSQLKEEAYADWTVFKAHTIIKMVFDKAKRYKEIRENPAEFVDTPSVRKRIMDFWDEEEAKNFFNNEEIMQSREYIAFLLAFSLGMRLGEVLALKFRDVNFVKKTVIVRRLLQRNGMKLIDIVKTDSSNRTLIADDFTLGMIKRQKAIVTAEKSKLSGKYKDNDLICCTKLGTPINASNLRRVWHKLIDISGNRIIRFHDLRHTHATLILQQPGADIKMVSERLGHKDIKITLETYYHVLPGKQEQAVKNFGDFFFKQQEK